MAETDNIAKLAEIVSNDLLARFFWGRSGSWNQNWPCENQRHLPRKTHPSDVVFYYDEPYSLRRAYFNWRTKAPNPGMTAPLGLAEVARRPFMGCRIGLPKDFQRAIERPPVPAGLPQMWAVPG